MLYTKYNERYHCKHQYENFMKPDYGLLVAFSMHTTQICAHVQSYFFNAQVFYTPLDQ